MTPHLFGLYAVHWVYIIQSKKTKALYIGETDDLNRRLAQHNGNKSFSTKDKGPWILVYAEVYKSKEDAQMREKRLKYFGMALSQLKRRIKKSLL